MIKKVVSSFLSDTQKYRILINKVDEMSEYQLDSIISRRGGIDSFGIFLSKEKRGRRLRIIFTVNMHKEELMTYLKNMFKNILIICKIL